MKAILLLSALTLFVLSSVLPAKEVTIQLPPEPGPFKPASGVELAQANCLICHSAEYPGMQPTMTRKFWEGTVKKMREKYGAPLPEQSIPALVDYLTAAYGKPDAK